MQRQRQLERLRSAGTLDLLVVGGGAAGAAVLRAAALNDLVAALCERDDFASGTSSRSTRLIHGGLRYLEHGHLRLVIESLRERRTLLEIAPHLVEPLALHIPVYRGAGRARWRVRAGLWLYDRLAGSARLGPSGTLDAATVAGTLGGLARTGLREVAVFHDARVRSPERLVVETLIDAVECGAIAVNRLELAALERDGRTLAATLRDRTDGDMLRVRARTVVNAAGPWIAEVDRRAAASRPAAVLWSRGSHLLLAPFAGAPTRALLVEAPRDKRPVFILPWEDHLVVGTTEEPHTGRPGTARATDEEIDYLRETFAHVWPAARGERPYAAYAGVRALPVGSTPARADRRHRLLRQTPEGLLTLLGGKLTTHRLSGEEIVVAVLELLGRRPSHRQATAHRPLPGAMRHAELADARRLAARHGWTPAEATTLLTRWGARAWAVAAERPAAPALGGTGGLRPEEILFAMRQEGAWSLDDVLLRRTSSGHAPGLTRAGLLAAARVWAWQRAGRPTVIGAPGETEHHDAAGPPAPWSIHEATARAAAEEAERVAALLADEHRRELR